MKLFEPSIPLLYTMSFALGCTPGSSEENSAYSGEDGAAYDERLQDGLDEIHAGGVVAAHGEVNDGARRLLARSGTAELDSAQPVDFDGYVRMGSNTKTFVSVVKEGGGEGAPPVSARPPHALEPQGAAWGGETRRRARSHATEPAVDRDEGGAEIL